MTTLKEIQDWVDAQIEGGPEGHKDYIDGYCTAHNYVVILLNTVREMALTSLANDFALADEC